MKLKSNVIITCKLIIVCALIWYLPTRVVSSVHIIDGFAQGKEAQPDTPVKPMAATKNKNIHIYNTHQAEEYQGFNVVEGAHYLKDSLMKRGYSCDVEGNNFEQYKNVHKIDYSQSYVVSKMYLEKALSSGGPYDLIIDMHRDSIDRGLSTLTYNNVSYAKMMFVAGESSGKFDAVNRTSKDIATRLQAKVPGISRGVYPKKSHYNQGMSDHMVLIEIGGHQNNKQEIMASLDVLCQVIDEYLSGS